MIGASSERSANTVVHGVPAAARAAIILKSSRRVTMRFLGADCNAERSDSSFFWELTSEPTSELTADGAFALHEISELGIADECRFGDGQPFDLSQQVCSQ